MSGGSNTFVCLSLVGERNKCLRSFYDLNFEAIENFKMKKFVNVREFFEKRQKLIQNIQRLDKKIYEQKPPVPPPTPEQSEAMSQLLKEKNKLVANILWQDLEILTCIEEQKLAA